MTITEAVTGVYLRSVGKATPPATTSTKYSHIIGLLDFYQRRWAREPGVDWNSLYDPASSVGTVTATDTYDLDTNAVRKLSDRQGDTVRIAWTDGVGYTEYDIVDHDALKGYSYGVNKESPLGFYCAQIGTTLVFNHKFISTDAQYGGTITAPVYAFPDAITSTNPGSNDVQVDDPDWLVTQCAAEYVRNDITRRARYPELAAEAAKMMERMKEDNDGQIDSIIKPWTPFTGTHNQTGWGNSDNSSWSD